MKLPYDVKAFLENIVTHAYLKAAVLDVDIHIRPHSPSASNFTR